MKEPTGTQRHVNHIMCGMDRFCGACQKVWFAAVQPEDTPLCKREEWQPGCNWYPSNKATHSPVFKCFAGEECKMCLELGINAGKPPETVWDADGETGSRAALGWSGD